MYQRNFFSFWAYQTTVDWDKFDKYHCFVLQKRGARNYSYLINITKYQYLDIFKYAMWKINKLNYLAICSEVLTNFIWVKFQNCKLMDIFSQPLFWTKKLVFIFTSKPFGRVTLSPIVSLNNCAILPLLWNFRGVAVLVFHASMSGTTKMFVKKYLRICTSIIFY